MSGSVAELGLAIDSSPVTAATTALDRFSQSAAKSETVIKAIQAAADREGISFAEMAKRVDDASAATEQNTKSTDRGAKSTDNATESHKKHGKAADDNGKAIGKLSEMVAVLEARELKLAGSMGMAGALLSVIGPGGLAAAAGLGALVVAMDLLVGSANRMGELAKQLDNVKSITGLSTDALQALQTMGVGVGLTSDQTTQALTRLSTQMSGLRDGSGTLATALRRIDPELLAQISGARDETTALNLLAQAYAKAGDEAAKNSLARAAAGGSRGAGVQFGGLLQGIADKGSVDGVIASVNKLDLLTAEQIKTWKKLTDEIDAGMTNAKNNVASVFTTSVLEGEKQFADKFLEFSRDLKAFQFSEDFKTLIAFLTNPATVVGGATISFLLAPWLTLAATIGAIGIKLGMDKIKSGAAAAAMSMPDSLTPTFSPRAPAGLDESDGLNMSKRLTESIGNQANAQRLLTAALGSAATATELLKGKQLALQAAYEAGDLGTVGKAETLLAKSRAEAALALDAEIAKQGVRNGATGSSPTIAEILKAKAAQQDNEKDHPHNERDEYRLPAAA